jgi:hypothetical protein
VDTRNDCDEKHENCVFTKRVLNVRSMLIMLALQQASHFEAYSHREQGIFVPHSTKKESAAPQGPQ